MRNVWAVTRETFIQCARTRIIAVFAILLVGCVLAVGFTMTGDGTLKGRIQTFLAYSISLTQLLLCLVAIFLATGAVTADISHKYIFTVVSKPLSRWQYILGRWCGVVLLTGLLLATALGAIYALAQHLRGTQTRMEQKASLSQPRPGQEHQPDLDRLAVENEVFAARATYQPDPFNIDNLFQRRMKRLIEEKGLDNLIRGRIRKKLRDEQAARQALHSPQRTGGPATPDEAEVKKRFDNVAVRQKMLAEVEADLRMQIMQEVQLVRPGSSIRLTFSGLSAAPPDGPLLQIRYTLHPFQSYISTLKSVWKVVNPETGHYTPNIFRSDSRDTPSSFMVDPRAITSDGRLSVFYLNLPDPKATVKIVPEEITVLQHVGGFEGNLVRAGLLILLRLMFLTAIAVLFSVFLSFPIACLSCLMIFVIGMMSGFIHDATRLPAVGPPAVFDYFSHYLAKGVFWVLPAFSGTSATNSLIDGANIPWQTVAREYLVAFEHTGTDSNVFWQTLGLEIETGMGLRTLLALAIGWLIFRRRELAGVQV